MQRSEPKRSQAKWKGDCVLFVFLIHLAFLFLLLTEQTWHHAFRVSPRILLPRQTMPERGEEQKEIELETKEEKEIMEESQWLRNG